MNTPTIARSAAPRRLASATLVAGALIFGLPALAHGADAVAVPVQYSPAALKTDAGARAVHAQIRRAARQACGSANSPALQHKRAVRECREEAVARAVDEIGSPTLATVHAREGTAPRLAGAGELRTSR
ncbi:MAG: UrcA family protein [Steroidobacteraceae bacterium]|jgi:UrcA family protein|nr:UrcA family protein [Steroidobacteraceae bacterium]